MRVTHYKAHDGGIWIPWPFIPFIKPGMAELQLYPKSEDYLFHFIYYGQRLCVRLVALKFYDTSIWTAKDGFQRRKDDGDR